MHISTVLLLVLTALLTGALIGFWFRGRSQYHLIELKELERLTSEATTFDEMGKIIDRLKLTPAFQIQTRGFQNLVQEMVVKIFNLYQLKTPDSDVQVTAFYLGRMSNFMEKSAWNAVGQQIYDTVDNTPRRMSGN